MHHYKLTSKIFSTFPITEDLPLRVSKILYSIYIQSYFYVKCFVNSIRYFKIISFLPFQVFNLVEVCYQCHLTHYTREKQETHQRLSGTESQRCMCLSPSLCEISRDSPTQSSRYCEYIENEESQSISYCDVQMVS